MFLAKHVTHDPFLQWQEGVIPETGLQKVEDLRRQRYSAAVALTVR